jgi:chemotaxis protein MotB
VRRRRRLNRRVMVPSHERWFVSYADFITLLFAFFTVMYASSTVDAHKLATMVESMQQVFKGPPPPPTGTNAAAPATQPVEPPPPPSPPPPGTDLAVVRQLLEQDLQGELQAGHVSIEPDSRGLVVSIQESGSFSTGSADLPPAAQALLGRLAARLREIDNAVRVEGHTDDVPIQTTRYRSNWDLSTARATGVVAFLIQSGDVDASRLSAAGYSEYHPRVPNDSTVNRARNRRVDLVILNTATRRAEEPGRR